MELEEEEKGQMLGDSLPIGLRLVKTGRELGAPARAYAPPIAWIKAIWEGQTKTPAFQAILKRRPQRSLEALTE